MRALRLALAITVLLISSIVFMGCGHKSGREVNFWNDYNLKVKNRTSCRVHVHLDGGHLGTVDSWDTDYFRVKTGTYEVSLHASSLLHDDKNLGQMSFTRDEVVSLTYD